MRTSATASIEEDLGLNEPVPQLTLRPEVEVRPGRLEDGFVMVSGLGPSWSASGVATLRWRLAGRAG